MKAKGCFIISMICFVVGTLSLTQNPDSLGIFLGVFNYFAGGLNLWVFIERNNSD